MGLFADIVSTPRHIDSGLLILVLLGIITFVLIVLLLVKMHRSTHVKEVGSDSRSHWQRVRPWERGELHVDHILSSLGPDYTVLHDMVLLSNGYTVQIDHIVVSRFGIFCIETKTHSGKIYGSEKSEFWTQYVGNKKYPLRNPIRQNYGHMKTIERVLEGLPWAPIIPIVAFAGKVDLNLSLENSLVVYSSQLASTIQSYRVGHIAPESVPIYAECIRKAMTLVTEEQRDNHIAQIQREQLNKKSQLSGGYCPRCGRPLVLRRGQHGTFWGCHGYPSCRFTAQYDPSNPSVPKKRW